MYFPFPVSEDRQFPAATTSRPASGQDHRGDRAPAKDSAIRVGRFLCGRTDSCGKGRGALHCSTQAQAVLSLPGHRPCAGCHWGPTGIDYIIDVLNTRDESFKFERPIAAEALGKFNEKKVVLVLVGALKDDTYQDIDRHLPQVDYAGHKPYMGRYYSVQHAAAKSLTQLTGKDWGLFYVEDHGTWSAWLQSKNPDAFSPSTVVRTDAESQD